MYLGGGRCGSHVSGCYRIRRGSRSKSNFASAYAGRGSTYCLNCGWRSKRNPSASASGSRNDYFLNCGSRRY